MINTGDKFTAKDLRQSVEEVCRCNIVKYIDRAQSTLGVLIGDNLVRTWRYSPEEYARMRMQQYGAIQSSAIRLDRQLFDRGFKTAYKFSYEYNTGELGLHEIVRDAYRLEWFAQLADTAVPQAGHYDAYWDNMHTAFCVSYYYAQYLWAMNPRVCGNIARALACPDSSRWGQIIGAVLGVGFQFHPADVYEFSIEHTRPELPRDAYQARYADQEAFQTLMREGYGIDTGCLVLSPQNRKKLYKIVTRTDRPYWIQVIGKFLSGNIR